MERGRQTRDAKRIRNKSRLKLFVWSLEANTSYENELTGVLISSCVQRLIVCCEKSSQTAYCGCRRASQRSFVKVSYSRGYPDKSSAVYCHIKYEYCITRQEAYKSVLITHGKQMVFFTSINLFNEKFNGKA